MDGRWKRRFTAFIVFGMVGCSRSQVVPPGPLGTVSNKPIVEERRDRKEGPISVDTLVKMAAVHAAAAVDQGHSPVERQTLVESAKSEFQQVLQRDPKNMEAYGGLAQLYTNLGDKEHAMETYERAAKIAPNSSDVYVAMALCCKQFQDRTGAIEYLHMATKINPNDRRLKINLGFELAMAGRDEEATAWLTTALGKVQGHYGLAQAYEHQGLKGKAQEQLQIALQADPSYKPARDLMAKLTAPEETAPADSGVRTVSYEGLMPPNAKLISQPDPRMPLPEQPSPERKQSPAASMAPPEPIPVNAQRTIPPMLPSNGWER